MVQVPDGSCEHHNVAGRQPAPQDQLPHAADTLPRRHASLKGVRSPILVAKSLVKDQTFGACVSGSGLGEAASASMIGPVGARLGFGL